MRRGRIPALLLAALLEGPAHGYELMDRLEQFSGGSWRPSPGSVYPLLQMFQDRGLVQSAEEQGRRTFSLTDAGREVAESRPLGDPARSFRMDPQHGQLRTETLQLRAAVRQVAAAATPAQTAAATEIVRGARQALYRLLAGD
jgi:DNA-binding PadR family transcriptional regulator